MSSILRSCFRWGITEHRRINQDSLPYSRTELKVGYPSPHKACQSYKQGENNWAPSAHLPLVSISWPDVRTCPTYPEQHHPPRLTCLTACFKYVALHKPASVSRFSILDHPCSACSLRVCVRLCIYVCDCMCILCEYLYAFACVYLCMGPLA